jgi:hypothetical protein
MCASNSSPSSATLRMVTRTLGRGLHHVHVEPAAAGDVRLGADLLHRVGVETLDAHPWQLHLPNRDRGHSTGQVTALGDAPRVVVLFNRRDGAFLVGIGNDRLVDDDRRTRQGPLAAHEWRFEVVPSPDAHLPVDVVHPLVGPREIAKRRRIVGELFRGERLFQPLPMSSAR